jgi:hypothetical protein
MAIDPQSLQILGMVLDRQERRQGAAAQRGHEMNMTNLNFAQRNLENQINMNFQRQQNAQAQLDTLRSHFAEIGLKDKFGNDSQLSEMSERIEGSLIEQSDQLDNIVDLQTEELATLRNVRSAFTRGSRVASTFDATFDEDFNLDPYSDFGAVRRAVGNEDELARILEERDIEIGTDPRERHAFIQGVSEQVRDKSGLIEREMMKSRAIAERRAADLRELELGNADLENFRSRMEAAEEIAPDVTKHIGSGLLILTDPEASDSDKRDARKNIDSVLRSGAYSVTEQIASMSGVDIDELNELEIESQRKGSTVTLSEEQKKTARFYRDMEQSYQENAFKHINNLLSNSEAFVGSIQGSWKELERAFEEPGVNTIEDVIAGNLIAPSDLGNIFAFVANPYLNDTMGVGFQSLNDIISRTIAQRELRENMHPSTAAQKATDAFRNRKAVQMGDRFRTFASENLFPELGDGDGDPDPGTGSFTRNAEEIFGSEPELLGERTVDGYNPDFDFQPESTVERGIRHIRNRIRESSNIRKKNRTFMNQVDKLESIANQIDSGNLSNEELMQAQFDYVKLARLLRDQEDIVERFKDHPGGRLSPERMTYNKFQRLMGRVDDSADNQASGEVEEEPIVEEAMQEISQVDVNEIASADSSNLIMAFRRYTQEGIKNPEFGKRITDVLTSELSDEELAELVNQVRTDTLSDKNQSVIRKILQLR